MPRTLSNKQKKIARVASQRNKITGADFTALRKNKSKNGTSKKSKKS